MDQAFNTPYPNIKYICTTMTGKEHMIKSLKTKNSYSYDVISIKILKITSPSISSPLNYVSNKIRGIFRPRQLPRAVDLKGQLLSCQSY